MDTLHGMIRALNPDHKSEPAKQGADHLSVFREFISHLDRISKHAPKPSRPKASRAVKRESRR